MATRIPRIFHLKMKPAGAQQWCYVSKRTRVKSYSTVCGSFEFVRDTPSTAIVFKSFVVLGNDHTKRAWDCCISWIAFSGKQRLRISIPSSLLNEFTLLPWKVIKNYYQWKGLEWMSQALIKRIEYIFPAKIRAATFADRSVAYDGEFMAWTLWMGRRCVVCEGSPYCLSMVLWCCFRVFLR